METEPERIGSNQFTQSAAIGLVDYYCRRDEFILLFLHKFFKIMHLSHAVINPAYYIKWKLFSPEKSYWLKLVIEFPTACNVT